MKDEAAIRVWLIEQIARELDIPPSDVAPDQPFESYGLSSREAIAITGDLEDWLGRGLSPTLVYEFPTVRALARHLAAADPPPSAPWDPNAASAPRTSGIAIVGWSCEFPQAGSPEAYWRVLEEARWAVSTVPAGRWTTPIPADVPRWGGFIDNPAGFDSAFFGIAPREADAIDPQQRLLLETAWEALERAAINPESLAASETGIFVGISTSDYAFLQRTKSASLSPYTGTGNALAIAANRIAYLLDLRGPSASVDTACSSALAALHQACRSLEAGDCDAALVGAVNLMLTPDLHTVFHQAGMLAPDGRCKTFDARADGYVRGEGCAVLVLKRLEEALAADDPIAGVVRGSALNHGGRSNGLTAPNGAAQQSVIGRALKNAGLTPSDLDYIETHGTGTRLGDPIEMDALRAVMAGRQGPPCWAGSAKTNVGHLEAAAGMAGLCKVLLALEHESIPPHLHLETINPLIDLGGVLRVSTEPVPWPRRDRIRRAGVSAFGFGGANAHVIVEEPPPRNAAHPDSACHGHILTLSAKTPAALRTLAANLAAVFEHPAPPGIADVCTTLNTGRAPLPHRAAACVADAGEALAQLRAWAETGEGATPVRSDALQPVFLFTGQGAQHPGMGRELYEAERPFRETMDACAAVFEQETGEPLRDLVFSEDQAAKLANTRNTQPALFALEMAAARLWESWGVRSCAVLGHSIGELAAACVAGAFSVEDGMRLVIARAHSMAALPAGGAMAAIACAPDTVQEVLAEMDAAVAAAAYNGPQLTVISGPEPAVEEIRNIFEKQGVAARRLAVSHAFHSALMDPAVEPFRTAAQRIAHRPLALPLASNRTGKLIPPGTLLDADHWAAHLREPVRFAEGMAALANAGCRAFLETGPDAVLLGMGKRCIAENNLWLPTMRKGRNAAKTAMQSLAVLWQHGAGVDWTAVNAASPGRRIALPTYPFEHRRHWFEAEDPAHFACRVIWREVPAGTGPGTARVWTPDKDCAIVDACMLLAAEAEQASSEHRPLAAAIPDGAAPVGAALLASGRTLLLEDPGLALTLVDLCGADAGILGTLPAGHVHLRWWNGRWEAPTLETGVSAGRNELPVSGEGIYLVTGGLGAAGLEIAKWLAQKGAKELVLAGRTPLPPEDAWDDVHHDAAALRHIRAVRALMSQGVRVSTLPVDVGVAETLQQSLVPWKGRIRGVVHAAGVTEQALARDATTAVWERVLHPKVTGMASLVAALQDEPLDFLVGVSSMAAVLGAPAQAPYAAANAAMEALGQASALPFRCVQWGPLETGGMMRVPALEQAFAQRGIAPLTYAGALCAFDHLPLDESLCWMSAEWERLDRALLRVGLRHPGSIEDAEQPAAEASLLPDLASLEEPKRTEILEGYLREGLARALGAEAAAINPDHNLLALGLDSIMIMELVRQVEKDTGLRLHPREVFERPTAAEMAAYLSNEFARNPLPPGVSASLDETLPPEICVLGEGPRIAPTRKLGPAAFILSSPRAGSTLLRVMLAGHPGLFCPPELHLLPFAVMAERSSRLGDAYLHEGLLRAQQELDPHHEHGFTPETPIDEAYAWLQERCAPRLLVDKSPSYAIDVGVVRRAEALFEAPRYIHLVRHPAAVIESFARNRFDRLLGLESGDPHRLGEAIWLRCNVNLLHFAGEVPPERFLELRYEDLLANPEAAMRRVCTLLGVDFDAAVLDPYRGSRMTEGVKPGSLGIGDPNFGQRTRLEPELAEAWRKAALPHELDAATRALAGRLGYELPLHPPETPAGFVDGAL